MIRPLARLLVVFALSALAAAVLMRSARRDVGDPVTRAAGPAGRSEPSPPREDAGLSSGERQPSSVRASELQRIPAQPAGTSEAAPPNLLLRVRTVGSLRGEQRPVPNVSLELGVEWRAWPGENASLPRDPVRTLATTTTDELGRAEVELELPASWLELERGDLRSWVFARTAGPGWCPSSRAEPFHVYQLAQPDQLEYEIVLPVRAGGALSGIVVDAEGEPTDAVLYLMPDEGRTLAGTSRPESGFEIRFEQEGWHTLFARGVAGTGELRVALSKSSAPAPVRVQLVGPGTLAGIVVDRSGRPVPRYDLLALHASIGGTSSEPESFKSNHELERARGLASGTVRTDAEGTFRIRGLQDGLFVMRGQSLDDDGFDLLLTPQPVPAGSEDLTLVVEWTALLIRARDASGREVPLHMGAPIGFDWAHEPHRLLVLERDESGQLPDSSECLEGHLVEGGQLVAVEAGKDYLVVAYSRTGSPVAREVHVPDPGVTRPVDLDLTPEAAPGILRLVVLDPGGEPLREPHFVHVRAEGGGPILIRASLRGSSNEGTAFELGAGAYELLVTDGVHRRPDGERRHSRDHVPAKAPVVLAAGVEELVRIPLGPAGRIELGIECEGPPGPTDGQELSGPEWVRLYERQRWDLGGARVHVVPAAGGPPRSLLFALPPEATREEIFGPPEGDWIVPGAIATCLDALPAGEWTLVAEAEGYERAEAQVVVRAGGVTVTRLALEPRAR